MIQPTPDEREGGEKRPSAHEKATLFVLTLTLVAAALAATFTGWQAWIARKQLAIARDAEVRQLRAYVFVAGVRWVMGDDQHPLGIRITLRNGGETPAYAILTNMTVAIMPAVLTGPIEDQIIYYNGTNRAKLTEPYLYRDRTAELFIQKQSVGRPNIVVGPKTSPGPEEWPYLATYVWGTISYLDAFRIQRDLLFCYYVPGTSTDADVPRLCDQHNEEPQLSQP